MGTIKEKPTLIIQFDSGARAGVTDSTPEDIAEIMGEPLPVDSEYERQQQSGQDVSNIPNWSTWTEAQAIDHINANVTDLASAKIILVAMARMLVALRNKNWPNLEGST